jgi:hypothetical protein
MDGLHLTQFDLVRLRCPGDDPRLAEFAATVERMQALAESSEGFVWQLTDPPLSPAAAELYADPKTFVTLYVWRDLEALRRFAWHTDHLDYFQRRKQRFDDIAEERQVMWWVREGHRPGLTEALARLRLLETKGASRHAFDWHSLPEPDVELG